MCAAARVAVRGQLGGVILSFVGLWDWTQVVCIYFSLLSHFTGLFLRQGFSLAWTHQSIILAELPAPNIFLSLYPQGWDFKCNLTKLDAF